MAERRSERYLLLFLVLLAANLVVLALNALGRNDGAAAARIEEVQMNADRIRVLGAAARGVRSGAEAERAPSAPQACLEWAPFAEPALARAQSELARLRLAQAPVQRAIDDGSGAWAFLVQEPDQNTIASITRLRQVFPGTHIRAIPCP
jgi:hypothetical protein